MILVNNDVLLEMILDDLQAQAEEDKVTFDEVFEVFKPEDVIKSAYAAIREDSKEFKQRDAKNRLARLVIGRDDGRRTKERRVQLAAHFILELLVARLKGEDPDLGLFEELTLSHTPVVIKKDSADSNKDLIPLSAAERIKRDYLSFGTNEIHHVVTALLILYPGARNDSSISSFIDEQRENAYFASPAAMVHTLETLPGIMGLNSLVDFLSHDINFAQMTGLQRVNLLFTLWNYSRTTCIKNADFSNKDWQQIIDTTIANSVMMHEILCGFELSPSPIDSKKLKSNLEKISLAALQTDPETAVEKDSPKIQLVKTVETPPRFGLSSGDSITDSVAHLLPETRSAGIYKTTPPSSALYEATFGTDDGLELIKGLKTAFADNLDQGFISLLDELMPEAYYLSLQVTLDKIAAFCLRAPGINDMNQWIVAHAPHMNNPLEKFCLGLAFYLHANAKDIRGSIYEHLNNSSTINLILTKTQEYSERLANAIKNPDAAKEETSTEPEGELIFANFEPQPQRPEPLKQKSPPLFHLNPDYRILPMHGSLAIDVNPPLYTYPRTAQPWQKIKPQRQFHARPHAAALADPEAIFITPQKSHELLTGFGLTSLIASTVHMAML